MTPNIYVILFSIVFIFWVLNILTLLFSLSTLYYSSKSMHLNKFWETTFEKLYFSFDNYIMFSIWSTFMTFIFSLMILPEGDIEIVSPSVIPIALIAIFGITSVVVAEINNYAELKIAGKNSKRLLSYLMLKKIKKQYSYDTSLLVKELYFKGIENAEYPSDRVPLQKIMVNLTDLIAGNTNKDANAIIENALKSNEFLDLSGPLLNILNNEELFAFVQTKTGSDSINPFLKELTAFILELKQDIAQVNNIKGTLTEAELILEIENLTKTKFSKTFL